MILGVVAKSGGVDCADARTGGAERGFRGGSAESFQISGSRGAIQQQSRRTGLARGDVHPLLDLVPGQRGRWANSVHDSHAVRQLAESGPQPSTLATGLLAGLRRQKRNGPRTTALADGRSSVRSKDVATHFEASVPMDGNKRLSVCRSADLASRPCYLVIRCLSNPHSPISSTSTPLARPCVYVCIRRAGQTPPATYQEAWNDREQRHMKLELSFVVAIAT